MSNIIHFCGTKENTIKFLKSSIQSSKEAINHYNFVISDISSDISDPVLQATKRPTLDFLVEMRAKWIRFQKDLENQLKNIEKEPLV